MRDVGHNKPDELLKACAEKGGIIGISLFAPGLAAGNDATVEDYLDAMAYVIDLVGESRRHRHGFLAGAARVGFQLWANRDKARPAR